MIARPAPATPGTAQTGRPLVLGACWLTHRAVLEASYAKYLGLLASVDPAQLTREDNLHPALLCYMLQMQQQARAYEIGEQTLLEWRTRPRSEERSTAVPVMQACSGTGPCRS